jgi:protein TonB
MKMSVLAVPAVSKYGAIELKQVSQKYFTRALAVASIIHLFLIGIYWVSVYLSKEEPPTRIIKIVKYTDLGPPPSIAGASNVAPAVSVSGPVSRPTVGIPVPVPDAEVSTDQTIMSQQELSQQMGPIATDGGTSTGVQQVIEQDIQVEDEPPPEFVPFEKEPIPIKVVQPEFPKIAQIAGQEGKVIAHLWVDKQGKVRDVKIIKSDNEIFNQAVIDAAKQYLFTPAMMNNGPVAVWIAVPFSFELK